MFFFSFFFFFSSRRRHTRSLRDWSSDVCSSDLSHELPLRSMVALAGGRLRCPRRGDLIGLPDGRIRICLLHASRLAHLAVRSSPVSAMAAWTSPHPRAAILGGSS